MKTNFIEDLSKSFIYKVLGIGVGFLVQIIISRYLGIDNYGIWNKAISWMQIFMTVSLLGNTKLLLRDASKVKKKAYAQYRTTILQVIVSFIFIYLVYFLVGFGTDYISTNFLIAVLIAFCYGVFKTGNKLNTSMIRALQKNYLSIVIDRLATPIITLLLIFLFYLFFDKRFYLLVAFPLAVCAAFIIYIYLIRTYYETTSWDNKYSIYFNIDFWINSMSKSLLPYINIAILSFLVSDSDIGGYTAAYKIGEFLMVFSSIFVSFSPVIVRFIKQKKKEQLEKSYMTINKLLLVVVFPFLMFILMFTEDIILIFGEDFSHYAPVLQLLTIGVYMDAVTGPIGEILNMSGNEKIEKNINVTMGVFNLCLIYLFTINFGIIGAALAYSIPRFIANGSKLYFVSNALQIRTFNKKHLKIVGLQILLVCMIYFELGLISSLAVYLLGMLTFVVLIYFLGLITKKDVQIIRNI